MLDRSIDGSDNFTISPRDDKNLIDAKISDTGHGAVAAVGGKYSRGCLDIGPSWVDTLQSSSAFPESNSKVVYP